MKIPRFIVLSLLILLVSFVTWDFTFSQHPLIKPIFVGIDDLKDVNTSGASDGNVLTWSSANEAWEPATSGSGAGDFSGPGSSADNAIVRFDGTGGKTGQNSGITISDTYMVVGAIGLEYAAETTATPSASFTVDWTAKQVQRVTITGVNLDITFTNPAGPCRLVLVVVQGDGSDTIDWTNEADILWPGGVDPVLSTGASDIDVVTFYFDGTDYFGVANYDFD